MRQHLRSVVLVLLGVSCGGSTGVDNEQVAGSAGANSGAGSGSNEGGSKTSGGASAAGTTSTAGTTNTAGTTSAGGSHGGSGGVDAGGYGGVITVGGTGSAGSNTGGSGMVNPDCPAHVPMGACSGEDANVSCQYDPGTGCLCYPSAPGTFVPCQKVDPTCTFMAMPASPPREEGVGGTSAKIALPPRQICSCNGTSWLCNFGP